MSSSPRLSKRIALELGNLVRFPYCRNRRLTIFDYKEIGDPIAAAAAEWGYVVTLVNDVAANKPALAQAFLSDQPSARDIALGRLSICAKVARHR
jgi:hypothetical protein